VISSFYKLTAANILNNFIFPVAGLIDLAILGHLNDLNILGGVALATIVFDFMYNSCNFLRLSTTARTAQAFGARNFQEVKTILLQGLFFALIIGGGILLVHPWIDKIAHWVLQGEKDSKLAASHYFYARIWGAPAVLSQYVLTGWFLGLGKIKFVFIINLFLAGINIIGDILFVFYWKLGAWGAGYASMISEYTGFFVALIIWRFAKKDWNWGSVWQSFHFPTIRDFFLLQGNYFIRSLTLILTLGLFTNVSAFLGEIVLVTNMILMRILISVAYFIDGIAYGLEILVGQFFGGKQFASIKKIWRYAFWLNTGINLTVSLVIIIWMPVLLKFFTYNYAVIELGNSWRFFLAISLFFGGYAFILDGFFIGLGEARKLRGSIVFSAGVGILVAGITYLIGWSPDFIWYGLSCFMAMRMLTLGYQQRYIWNSLK